MLTKAFIRQLQIGGEPKVTVNISNIFQAAAKTTQEYLIADGQCCYIPSYQRDYSWQKDNIVRLLEDVVHGLNQLLEREDVISFLGSVISIQDSRNRSVKPVFRPELPGTVKVIIDGQQRLCTLVMLNMYIHNLILNKLKQIPQGDLGDEFDWIRKHARQIASKLFKTIYYDKGSEEKPHTYYPRIIRAHEDVWSTIKSQAEYKSPIAKLLWDYLLHYLGESSSTVLAYKCEGGNEKHKVVESIYKDIRYQVNNCLKMDGSNYTLPTNSQLMSNELTDRLWNFPLPECVVHFVNKKTSHKSHAHYCTLLRLLTLAQYINQHMGFAVVKTENEDDAFDMFEALNTTGTPLTAIETFIPKVIETEGIEDFESSDSYPEVEKIKKYLSRFIKAEDKQSANSDVLIPFALYEEGHKLKKGLNEQRRFLRSRYSKIDSVDEKRDFVKSLALMTEFVEQVWHVKKNEKISFAPLSIDEDEVFFCMSVLRSLNHTIVLGHLFRFYEEAVNSDGESRVENSLELVKAIKATTAFSLLWRAAMGGTANIDNHYREILKGQMAVGSGDEKRSVPPLGKHRHSKAGTVSFENYRDMLHHILSVKGKIESESDWVNLVKTDPIFSSGKTVARALLYLVSNNTTTDPKEKGLIVGGKGKSTYPILTASMWKSEDYFSIEHIAPQSNQNWDKSIYEDPKFIDRIGNLALLPSKENKIIGNRPWDVKKVFYGALAAKTDEEVKSIIAQLKDMGVNLSKKSTVVFENSNYHAMYESLAEYPEEWGTEIINKRSERIASLAWGKLTEWLELS